MVRYILEMFHAHDEEIESIYLPICFSAILEVLTVRMYDLHPISIAHTTL